MSKEREPKGNPIPTRFDKREDDMLHKIAEQSGLDEAEIIRRGFRLLVKRYREMGNTCGFILDDLSPEALAVAEQHGQGEGEVQKEPAGIKYSKTSKKRVRK